MYSLLLYIYCGDQKRSYHGTTVQLVQPHHMLSLAEPSTSAITDENNPPSSLSIQKRNVRDISPASSPHKLGKVGPKRQRTVAVKKPICYYSTIAQAIRESTKAIPSTI